MHDRPAEHRLERARWHSRLSFLRRPSARPAEAFLADIHASVQNGQSHRMGTEAHLYVRELTWDSAFFACPTYRLDFVDWPDDCIDPLRGVTVEVRALGAWLTSRHAGYYLFADVPAEDLTLLQALGTAGFRLIETRLQYVHEQVQQASWPERFPVRPADEADIPNLREVAAQTRNPFDRFHAEPFFSTGQGDAMLSAYAENSVRGLADLVLVPAIDQEPADAFMATRLASAESKMLGFGLGQVVLAAVAPSRRGWHARLLVETLRWLQQQGVETAMMTTQATNRAVIRNCELLGWRLGRASHILARHGSDRD
jgi:dTDP-4-amino-4,6-dideoxy-D-galactose acyltransferase